MNRLTTRTPDGVTAANTAAALERLAQLEDLMEALQSERTEIARELEALRVQSKTKSLRFRELLARKLMTTELLARLGL